MKKDEAFVCAVIAGIGAIIAIIAIGFQSNTVKWTLDFVAISLFLLAIYVAIDAVIKNRKKPKDLTGFLIQSLEKQEKDPVLSQKLKENMDARAQKRDILFEKQQPNKSNYGYEPDNPIMTSSVTFSEVYLHKLRTLKGHPLTWVRSGSLLMKFVHGIPNVMVDQYVLSVNGKEYCSIYICPYGHNTTFIPKDLCFESSLEGKIVSKDDLSEETEGLSERVISDVILQITKQFSTIMAKNNYPFSQEIESPIKDQEIYNVIRKIRHNLSVIADRQEDESDYYWSVFKSTVNSGLATAFLYQTKGTTQAVYENVLASVEGINDEILDGDEFLVLKTLNCSEPSGASHKDNLWGKLNTAKQRRHRANYAWCRLCFCI